MAHAHDYPGRRVSDSQPRPWPWKGILYQTISLILVFVGFAIAQERRMGLVESGLALQRQQTEMMQAQLTELRGIVSKLSDNAVTLSANQAVVLQIIKDIKERHAYEDRRK